jgi:hypothetical protein
MQHSTRPRWRAADNARSRINNAITAAKASKADTTIELLGCTFKDLVNYLGLNENEGEMDHIFPLRAYDLTDPVEQRRAFNYRNLQLLSTAANREKGGKMPTEVEAANVPMEYRPGGGSIAVHQACIHTRA